MLTLCVMQTRTTSQSDLVVRASAAFRISLPKQQGKLLRPALYPQDQIFSMTFLQEAPRRSQVQPSLKIFLLKLAHEV